MAEVIHYVHEGNFTLPKIHFRFSCYKRLKEDGPIFALFSKKQPKLKNEITNLEKEEKINRFP